MNEKSKILLKLPDVTFLINIATLLVLFNYVEVI